VKIASATQYRKNRLWALIKQQQNENFSSLILNVERSLMMMAMGEEEKG
jgi:hypothetical protein